MYQNKQNNEKQMFLKYPMRTGILATSSTALERITPRTYIFLSAVQSHDSTTANWAFYSANYEVVKPSPSSH
jgi:hypothetical protein